LPKNPYTIENAHILISSYKKIILIIKLTKKEISDSEYLLYRIYLLKLTYPLETYIILYCENNCTLQNSNLEKIAQVKFFNSKKELIQFLKKNKTLYVDLNHELNQHIKRIKYENFYRANLIFNKSYENSKRKKNLKSIQELLDKYKKNKFINLKNKRKIKKFQYFKNES